MAADEGFGEIPGLNTGIMGRLLRHRDRHIFEVAP